MLSYSEWLAQRSGNPAPNSTPTAPQSQPVVAAQPMAPANAPAQNAQGGVNWQGLYDPIQEYYWNSILGGKTVQTRDILGYDNPLTNDIVENLTYDEIRALEDQLKSNRPTPIAGMIGNEITSTLPGWYQESGVTGDNFDPGPTINYDSLRQFGDWQDTNIQDFLNSWQKYHSSPDDISKLRQEQIGDSGGADVWNSAWDSDLLNLGSLDKDPAFLALTQDLYGGFGNNFVTKPNLDPNAWLTEQDIDLREGTGWNPSMGVVGETPEERAIQAALMTGNNGVLTGDYVYDPNIHFMADLNDPSQYQRMLEAKQNPFDPVAQYLNQLDKENGVTGRNWFDHPDQNQWEKNIRAANPSKLQKFVSTPAFSVLTGIMTAGLAPGLTAALKPLMGGLAQYGSGALINAGINGVAAGATGGDVGKALLTGAVTGGLGGFAGNYAGNLAGGTSTLTGGVTNNMVKSLISQLIKTGKIDPKKLGQTGLQSALKYI